MAPFSADANTCKRIVPHFLQPPPRNTEKEETICVERFFSPHWQKQPCLGQVCGDQMRTTALLCGLPGVHRATRVEESTCLKQSFSNLEIFIH